jgi:hypothetical protein
MLVVNKTVGRGWFLAIHTFTSEQGPGSGGACLNTDTTSAI